MRRLLVVFLLVGLGSTPTSGQMTRERASGNRPVEPLFLAPAVISTASVTSIPKNNLNFTIRHVFGPVSSGIEDLFGIDGAANIRFGLEYGATDRLSIAVGRSRYEKLYDAGIKAAILQQTERGSPVSVSLKGNVAITTESNEYPFVDRLSYLGSVLIARRLSDRLSVQVTPMWTHANTVVVSTDQTGQRTVPEHDHFAIGFAAGFELSDVLTLLVEAVPVVGPRTPGTRDALAVGVDIDTGGHVFQLFFAASPWLTEQQVLARTQGDFFAGDFRLGFNVNRVFGFSSPQ